MNGKLEQSLIEAACQVRHRAYAPYSGFHVGAALQTSEGIFVGCNVENASFGLTVCAERVAVANAVAGGAKRFELLAIATSGGSAPCGACRQVLAEFCQDLPILLIDAEKKNRVVRTSLSDLLPDRFNFTPK